MNALYLSFFLILFSGVNLVGQTNYTISGYLIDSETGENIIQGNIYNKEKLTEGTTSNNYGFYSLTLTEGAYTLVYSYLGFDTQEISFTLNEHKVLNVELSSGVTFKEVVVTAEDEDKNIEGTQMGTISLPVESIKTLPALMGEVDVLKALQLLPGVISAGEGNSGFYVRGGGPDQNLILLDEAVVYNSGHLLGFFSVFNADAIKNTTLIKGGMPAEYGGRLSSVVDIQMKDGNNKKYVVEGGIGAVASRITVQGPIKKDQSSFIVSGRRTYAFDLAQPLIKNTDFAGTNYYFYDLNLKINHRFSQKDRLFASAYFGRDILNFNAVQRGLNFQMAYGNETATLRWNHLFSEKFFMNVTGVYNAYDFSFGGAQGDFTVDVFSGVKDYNLKLDFDYFPNPKHKIRFGVNATYHELIPNIARATSGEVNFQSKPEAKYATETAIYARDEIKLTDRLSINAGIRLGVFSHLGPYVDKEGNETDRGENVATYLGFEPRINAKFTLDAKSSIKAGYTHNYQFLHLVSNSASTLPIDIWVPSSPLVKPQLGIQYAIGYFRNFKDDRYEASVEAYYKDLSNQIDYRESYINNVAVELEEEFVFGDGRAYGVELFLKKRKGALNGWIGYTWSRSERSFAEINDGAIFPAKFDRTHDLSMVANYKLSPKWTFGGVFVFGTGNAFTPITTLFLAERRLRPEYGDRNSARIDDYHRLDLSATLTPKPDSEKRFQSKWIFSIYNVYNRYNTFYNFPGLSLLELDTGSLNAAYYKVSLFPIIPSITWNFSFNK